ncbi:MAG: DUF4870 domain-containing protein [Phycisphaerales bacterium]
MDAGESTSSEAISGGAASAVGGHAPSVPSESNEPSAVTAFGNTAPVAALVQPEQTDRLLAATIHVAPALLVLSTIASAGVLAWMPLAAVWILWLGTRGRSVFLDDHGRESMNFQISTGIFALVVFIAGFPTCSFAWWIGFPILSVIALVGCILATRASLLGRPYRYPATIRLISPAL